MTTTKLAAATPQAGDEPNLAMSPMIDLVFLLLIFFMVSSHLIIVQIDKNVRPSIAEDSESPISSHGRILVNIYRDGRVFGPNQRVLETKEDISSYIDEIRLLHKSAGVKSRLHIRADKGTDARNVKKVVQAAAALKLEDMIFSTHKVGRD